VLALLAIAVTFAANHVAARIAFDHGASVATAVLVRSGVTALALFALLRALALPMALAPGRRGHAAVIGTLVALQSFCLYSAVARIPVALALLAFNTFPMLLAAMSWVSGGERPSRRTLVAMPVALVGLALALDVAGKAGDVASRWAEIGAGVTWALAAAMLFAVMLLLTARWLKDLDGRLRSFLTMGVTAIVILAAGAATDAFALPRDSHGWLGLALLTLFYGSAITALFVVLPRVGGANYAVVLNFEPIALLFLAWGILGQSVTPLQLLGALIVIGAITLPALKR
jgi:drug/metabolite transporter (DMT)-like permease